MHSQNSCPDNAAHLTITLSCFSNSSSPFFFLPNSISNCNSIIFSGIALAFRHPSRKKTTHCSILEISEAQKYEPHRASRASKSKSHSQAHLYWAKAGKKTIPQFPHRAKMRKKVLAMIFSVTLETQ